MGYGEGNDKAISIEEEKRKRAQAILDRMSRSDTKVEEEPSIQEDSTDNEEFVVSVEKAPRKSYTRDAYQPEMECIPTREVRKPEPKHTIEITYDSGVDSITGGTNKFSVTVRAESVNQDADNISAVLAYDVILKPPAYTPLTVRINDGPAVQVLMGGTVKHGNERFLFLLKIKS